VIIETFPVGALQCNCTIVGDEKSKEAIVIDPGDEHDLIIEKLNRHGLTLRRIVCTHTHIDHVGAIFDLQQRYEVSAAIHEADLFLLQKLDVQAQWLGMPAPTAGRIDSFLKDGTTVSCTGVELGVLHTPGHTPGSTTFSLSAGGRLFTGDTLFLNGIGRTDLWGGSYDQIIASIRNKLLPLDDDIVVVPGHGASTTIGRERRTNPFLR
jgi:glyoxylase-like metal-dependent hydrolase (beta-lactamase superfamily II)